MATDRETLTRQVKDANDIVDVVGSYVTLHSLGGKFKALCPFHDDHRPSLVVDPKWQNYRCWACGKYGDVFTFIQEKERVDFLEARELLARRAGISLEKTDDSPQNRGRAYMLDVMCWADGQYQKCLLGDPQAEVARRYLVERKLSGEMIKQAGLGYAPLAGEWLVQRAAAAGLPDDILERVGLIARSNSGGYYDRFRDRVMFPIRNTRSQTVGFGGRILPSSPLVSRAPKYYNSSDTPLFTKSEQLYGIDVARQAGAQVGYLAVVEGYTDVLMAHQTGVRQVVATMGTALNARHIQQLRRFVPRVVLVFDADAGGNTGVDRALELFVSQEMDLAIATLPEGLDPCDLLVNQGPEPFQTALASAVDALDFKLNQLLASATINTTEGRRQAVESLLNIIALAPEMPGQGGQLKRELVINRISQRLAVNEQTLWARLKEIRDKPRRAAPRAEEIEAERTAPAAPLERTLLELLLADPELVAEVRTQIKPEDVQHPGLKQLLEGLYDLLDRNEPPELDRLRARIENVRLAEYALRMQELGRRNPDRAASLRELLIEFRRREQVPKIQDLQDRLHAAQDHDSAIELLRQLQKQND